VTSYLRVNVDSIEGLFGLMSARAATLGSTTRAQRATLYGMSESSLSALESGSRVPTEEEKGEILDAFSAIGASLYPEDLDTLPAAQP